MLDRHLAGEFHVCEQRQGHIWAASSVVFLYASAHDEFSHDLATHLETRVVRSLAMQVNLGAHHSMFQLPFHLSNGC